MRQDSKKQRMQYGKTNLTTLISSGHIVGLKRSNSLPLPPVSSNGGYSLKRSIGTVGEAALNSQSGNASVSPRTPVSQGGSPNFFEGYILSTGERIKKKPREAVEAEVDSSQVTCSSVVLGPNTKLLSDNRKAQVPGARKIYSLELPDNTTNQTLKLKNGELEEGEVDERLPRYTQTRDMGKSLSPRKSFAEIPGCGSTRNGANLF
jgi:hypothetical protein